jgi:hypothetical protein
MALKKLMHHDLNAKDAKERLLKDRDPEAEGPWAVESEDMSVDGYRTRHNHVGVVQGTYKEAVEWAVEQPEFYNYGPGGRLYKTFFYEDPKDKEISDLKNALQKLVDSMGSASVREALRDARKLLGERS